MTATAVWCCSQCGAIYHKDYPRCPNDGAEIVLEHRDPQVGKQIDHYMIDEVLGEGGMGRVYRAHHAQLPDKRYAIKVLLGDVAATTSMRKRFSKEAEIASRLDHPNLVRVVDIGVTGSGLPYIAMDLVEGIVLTDILDAAPMPPERVVALARAICEGLAYAHDAGLIHRDLKPDNVIIAPGDVPRLTDFGLVLTTDPGQERLTSTGMAMGTPAYAAPEQMAGKQVDHRVDLFALGLTMFEMLTGGLLPWEGSPMEIAAAKAHKDAPSIRERVPELDVPGDLEALVMRLLARHPAQRPGSAAEVIAQLDALQFPGHGLAAPAPPERSRRRAPRWWLAAGALVAAAAAGVGWMRWSQTPGYVSLRSTSGASLPQPPATASLRSAGPTAAPPVVTAAALPPPAVAPAAAPAPSSDSDVEIDPAPAPHAADNARVAPSRPAPAGATRHKHRKPEPAQVHLTSIAPPVAPPIAPVPAPVIAPSVVTPVPAPPAPLELHAAITGVDVHGALPAGDVERAVRRAAAGLDRCAPRTIQTVVVELTIGESRRAQNVRASGGDASSCVATALAGLRTESAPDVGDVNVTVRVAFAEHR